MKQSAPEQRKKKFLFRFVISYYVILLIPFLLVIFTLRTAEGVIMRQSNKEVQTALVQAKNITDANLRAMPSLAMSLRKDENVLNLYDKWKWNKNHVFSTYKVNHHIPQYNAVTSLISKVYLYFGKKTTHPRYLVIDNGSGMVYDESRMNLTFDNTSMTYAELNDYISARAISESYVPIPSTDPNQFSIYYMSDLISYPSPINSALVMVRLDDNFLNDLLQNATYSDQGVAFILDENHQILICRNGALLEEEFLDGLISKLSEMEELQFMEQGQLVNLVRSERNGWIYGSVIPSKMVLAKMHQVRRVVLSAFAALLGLSFLLLGILTRRNAMPLRRIYGELAEIYSEPGGFDSIDDFRFLESAISDLINRSKEQSGLDETRLQLLDLEVLGRLLLTGETDTPLFQESLSMSSLELEGRRMLVAYVHAHRMGRTAPIPSEELAAVYRAKMEEMLGAKLYDFNIDEKNRVFLISGPSTGNESELLPSIKEVINQLGEEFEVETQYHQDFFLSDPTDDYHKVSQCYAQCKELAMHVVKDKETYAYSSEDLPEKQQIFHYSLNQEIRLSQLIRYGSEAKLQELIDEIHYQNYELTTLNDAMQQSLFQAIRSSLQRGQATFYHEEEIHSLFLEMQDVETFDDLSRVLFSLQKAMQAHLRQNSARSNLDEIHQRILDYINQNYNNAALNQALLCEELGIAEQIMNHMFQEMGTSFHVYLENVRIDAACTLLQNQEVTIKYVADQVGYTSDVSFRRAFKRVLGISPSAFTKGQE